MKEAVQEAAHACLQKGEAMRKHTAQHPSLHRNLANVFDTTFRNIQSDAKGVVVNGQKVPVRYQLLITQAKRNGQWKRNSKHFHGIITSLSPTHLGKNVVTNYVLA